MRNGCLKHQDGHHRTQNMRRLTYPIIYKKEYFSQHRRCVKTEFSTFVLVSEKREKKTEKRIHIFSVQFICARSVRIKRNKSEPCFGFHFDSNLAYKFIHLYIIYIFIHVGIHFFAHTRKYDRGRAVCVKMKK